LGLEWLTRVHELGALGITLWSPAKALSLGLLLIKGLAFAPVLFLAALLADFLIYGANKSPASMLATSATIALGFSLLAVSLTRISGFTFGRQDLRGIVGLLLTVPAGTLVIACLYCGLLVLFGDLAARQYLEAVPYVWVGDTVGIIIVLPVAMAAASLRHFKPSTSLVLDAALFLQASWPPCG
jgi:integral membrane sensor domain MASE1